MLSDSISATIGTKHPPFLPIFHSRPLSNATETLPVCSFQRSDARRTDTPRGLALFASKPFALFTLNIRHRLFC